MKKKCIKSGTPELPTHSRLGIPPGVDEVNENLTKIKEERHDSRHDIGAEANNSLQSTCVRLDIRRGSTFGYLH